VATWYFALRPYVRDAAINQMDTAMTNAVNQIPVVGLPIPAGSTLPISDSTANALLANNTTNSNSVQNAALQFTPNQVLLDFKLYGQDCVITTVPQMQSGKLVATHVTVSGIIGLVLSTKDVTSLLNSHINDAQTRINHRVTHVRLLDHEMDVTVA
jgi:L-2-hydroxyglutarate oxidase LhgO